MISDYFKTTMTVSRGVVTGNKTTFAVVATVQCHIQPVAPTFQNGQWGRTQKEYRMYSLDEMRIGDKLTDQNGDKYEVFGAMKHNFRIGFRHYQYLIKGL